MKIRMVFQVPWNERFMSTQGAGSLPKSPPLHRHVFTVAQNGQMSLERRVFHNNDNLLVRYDLYFY